MAKWWLAHFGYCILQNKSLDIRRHFGVRNSREPRPTEQSCAQGGPRAASSPSSCSHQVCASLPARLMCQHTWNFAAGICQRHSWHSQVMAQEASVLTPHTLRDHRASKWRFGAWIPGIGIAKPYHKLLCSVAPLRTLVLFSTFYSLWSKS